MFLLLLTQQFFCSADSRSPLVRAAAVAALGGSVALRTSDVDCLHASAGDRTQPMTTPCS